MFSLKFDFKTILVVAGICACLGCSENFQPSDSDLSLTSLATGTPPIIGLPPECSAMASTAVQSSPGRLIGIEYRNSVRDLLGLPVSLMTEEELPSDTETDLSFAGQSNQQTMEKDELTKYLRLSLKVADAAVNGSYNSNSKCQSSEAPETCARRIFRKLATAAFRRPLADPEFENLMSFYRAETGTVDEKWKSVIRSILLSPKFLLKYTSSGNLDSFDLAARLAFFLWKSVPDDELLAAAQSDSLKGAAVLQSQVSRMLKNAKAEALDTDFPSQWLGLDNIRVTASGATSGVAMKNYMLQETQMVFADYRKNPKPFLDMFTSKNSYINEPLAGLYGVSGVTGTNFVPYTFPDNVSREGVFTQAAVLASNAGGGLETSPTARGLWMRRRVLCQDMGEPPDDVPSLPPANPNQTIRERMSAHLTSQSCAGCHRLIDPLGFPMEQFDAAGVFRSEYPNRRNIDPTSVLPSGASVQDSVQLVSSVASDAYFKSCLLEKYSSYASLRKMSAAEKCALRSMAKKVFSESPSLEKLIVEVVTSPIFNF